MVYIRSTLRFLPRGVPHRVSAGVAPSHSGDGAHESDMPGLVTAPRPHGSAGYFTVVPNVVPQGIALLGGILQGIGSDFSKNAERGFGWETVEDHAPPPPRPLRIGTLTDTQHQTSDPVVDVGLR